MKSLGIVVTALLESFGAFWLIAGISKLLLPDQITAVVKSAWWFFVIIWLLLSAYRLWPKRRWKFLVYHRDVFVELAIGDIRKQKGNIIVGSNTTFETRPEIIDRASIQGLFVANYCKDASLLAQQIKAQAPELPVGYGTTITVKGDKRTGYFCAIAELQNGAAARSSLESVREALGGLWTYLSNYGEKTILNVPVLGSGFSRLSESRDTLVKEIVLSFLASIADRSFCKGIRIVIYPSDIKECDMDVPELVRFVEYNCRYAMNTPQAQTVGRAEP